MSSLSADRQGGPLRQKTILTKIRHLGNLEKNEVLHLKGDWPVR